MKTTFGTKMLALVALVSVASFGCGAASKGTASKTKDVSKYCNGQVATDYYGSYFPNGQKVSDYYGSYYPNGKKLSNYYGMYYPNGQKVTDYYGVYYANAQKTKNYYGVYYPNGQKVKDYYGCYYANGAKIEPCPDKVSVRYNVPDTKIRLSHKLGIEDAAFDTIDTQWTVDDKLEIDFTINIDFAATTISISDIGAFCQ